MRILSIPFQWMIIGLCGFWVTCSVAVVMVPGEDVNDDTLLDEWRRVERQGRVEDARAGYEEMCRLNPMSGACYAITRLLFRMGHIQEARHRTISYITEQPEAALAPVAVRRLAGSYEEHHEAKSGLAVFRAMESAVVGTSVWDSVVYAQARMLRQLGHMEEERRVLMRIVDMGRWGSSLWDDSIWRVIAIARERNEQKHEEQLILQMLSARERSRWIGSYHSPYYDRGLFRLGHLYLEMEDSKRAYRAFRRLSQWETSRLRDDGLLWSARVLEAQGKVERACRHLRELLVSMSDSGSAPIAEGLMADWNCR